MVKQEVKEFFQKRLVEGEQSRLTLEGVHFSTRRERQCYAYRTFLSSRNQASGVGL